MESMNMSRYLDDEPIAFRLYADVRMNRPIDREHDYVGEDHFIMVMDGQEVAFDFEEYSAGVDDDDPTILHLMCKNPDYEYEDTNDITREMLSSVEAITEFALESEQDDLCPVALVSCAFVLPYEDFKQIDIPDDVLAETDFGLDVPAPKERGPEL
jgi:hypothetical protein